MLHSVKLKTIVLYGPMEAGKTSLLHALQGSELPNGTVSSMKPNEVVLVLPVRHLMLMCTMLGFTLCIE